jgi:hypothetical protein
MLDTLAAAYAEKGQFADAAPTARRALARAAQENQPALADEIRIRIALYQADRPFRDRDISVTGAGTPDGAGKDERPIVERRDWIE